MRHSNRCFSCQPFPHRNRCPKYSPFMNTRYVDGAGSVDRFSQLSRSTRHWCRLQCIRRSRCRSLFATDTAPFVFHIGTDCATSWKKVLAADLVENLLCVGVQALPLIAARTLDIQLECTLTCMSDAGRRKNIVEVEGRMEFHEECGQYHLRTACLGSARWFRFVNFLDPVGL